MKAYKILLMALFLAVFIAGCGETSTPAVSSAGPAPAVSLAEFATVSSTNPADGSTSVLINGKMTATFSEVIDPATCTTSTFTVRQGATLVPGSVTCVGKTATFNPASELAAGTSYIVTITTGVTDLAGNALLSGNKTWSFTTGTMADTVPPILSFTAPSDTATSVAINGNIAATFSEAMDPATITETTFTLMRGATSVSGTVSSSGSVVTFTPTSDLAANIIFTATITTGATDLAGNALTTNKVWSFTTGMIVVARRAAVDLGTSGTFAILSKSGITNIPTSAVTGNIGASPITGAAIGVTCPEVTGIIYSVDATGPLPCRVTSDTLLTTAVSDMETAYTNAAGRTLPDFTELGAGEIGGLTLTHGLYKWGTDVLISTDVTLSGDANDVWIFQVGQDLKISSATQIILSGGALPKNIFWQVAGQAVLGTTSVFNGNILSQTAIILNTGATLNGNALAQTAVTLDSNHVSSPNYVLLPDEMFDTLSPVITIVGEACVYVAHGTVYIDAGATALDDIDGVVAVMTSTTVDTSVIGTYIVTYTATDAAGNTATLDREVDVVDPDSDSDYANLALEKMVTASSLEDDRYAADLAVDGDVGTRWSSQSEDPQWIQIDLGAPTEVASVQLVWEAAYGMDYKIQTSNDATTWDDMYTQTGGLGGIEEIVFPTTTARYVRMYGTARGTQFGYSLHEFRVFGVDQNE